MTTMCFESVWEVVCYAYRSYSAFIKGEVCTRLEQLEILEYELDNAAERVLGG